ncbi:MAG: sugar phosphate isomerase/epimerase [Bryobacteraceae bacterium]
MNEISRRTLLGSLAATALAKPAVNPFCYGTYGMRMLSPEVALRTIAEVGYDGVEIALMPEYPTDPVKLTPADRKQIRGLLENLSLSLPCFLESIAITGQPKKREENLDRLKRAFELGHDLSPAKLPMVESVIGGKISEWEKLKGPFAEELRLWAKVAENAKSIVCFKPHAAHAVHSPERALWLVKEVGSRHLRIVYDYSHMSLEGFGLEESLKQLLPITPILAVKDAKGTSEKHDYLLPGDGTTNYLEYFRLLKKFGYTGDIAVEVSAMIHRKPGYEPVPTAKLCYQRLAPALEKAGIKRPAKKHA